MNTPTPPTVGAEMWWHTFGRVLKVKIQTVDGEWVAVSLADSDSESRHHMDARELHETQAAAIDAALLWLKSQTATMKFSKKRLTQKQAA